MEKDKFISYRHASKKNFGRRVDTLENYGIDRINAGSLQRIADSVELMAQNTLDLQLNYYNMRKSLDYFKEELEKKDKKIAVLKREIAKIRNKNTGRG